MSENFLSRWSKRKLEAREQEASKLAEESSSALQGGSVKTEGTVDVVKKPETSVPLDHPDIPELPLPTEADLLAVEQGGNIKAFMVDKVSTELRNKAFKALFSRPEFNVMDGLDIYIDDYNKFTPLTQEDIGKMTLSKQLLSRPDLELPKIGDVSEGLDAVTAPILEEDTEALSELDAQENQDDLEPLPEANDSEARVIPDDSQTIDIEQNLAERSFDKQAEK